MPTLTRQEILRHEAQKAVDVQNASNLRAVAAGLVRALDALDAIGIHHATAEQARHCITRAWVDKLASLAGIQDLGNANALEAHEACDRYAKDTDSKVFKGGA